MGEIFSVEKEMGVWIKWEYQETEIIKRNKVLGLIVIITEMKKKSEEFNNRLEQAKESEIFKMGQLALLSVKGRRKWKKLTEPKGLEITIKKTNIPTIGVPDIGQRKKGAKRIFKEIMTKI